MEKMNWIKVIGLFGMLNEERANNTTMCLEGKLYRVSAMVLTDSGSNHNYISPNLAQPLVCLFKLLIN